MAGPDVQPIPDMAMRLGLLLRSSAGLSASGRAEAELIAKEDRDVFLGIATRGLLFGDLAGEARRLLAECLAFDPMQLAQLIQPKGLPLVDAQLVLKAIGAVLPGVAGDLLRQVDGTDLLPDQADSICRVLDLIEAAGLADRHRMSISPLMNSQNAKVRSRASVVVLRATARIDDAIRLLQDQDGRVQANIIEALWPIAGSRDAQRVFREHATSPVVRLANNCLIGMYLGGDPEAAIQLLANLKGKDTARSQAAAWAMGFLAAESFVKPLEEVRREGPSAARGAALRALVRLRNGSGCPVQLKSAKAVSEGAPTTGDEATGEYPESQSLSIEQLAQGVTAWNKWRRGGNEGMPELDGVDLSGMNLRGCDLSFCSLRDADLTGTDLTFSSLFGADLCGARFSDACLNYCDLRAAEIDYCTDLTRASTKGSICDAS